MAKFSTSESMRRAQAKYRAKLRDQRAAVISQHELMSRELAVARAERAALGVRADVLARTLCWQEDIIGALRRAFPEGAPRPSDGSAAALPSPDPSSAPFDSLAVRAPKLAAVAAAAAALSGGSLASNGPSVHYPALASELGRILDGPGSGQPGLLEAFLGGTLGPGAAGASQDRWRPLSLPGITPGQLAFLEGTAEFGAVVALGAAIRCGGPAVRCNAAGRVHRRSDPLDTVIEAYEVALEACPAPILPPRARAIYSHAPAGRWMPENEEEDWELELALSDIDHPGDWDAHSAPDAAAVADDASHGLVAPRGGGAHAREIGIPAASRPDDGVMSVPPVAALVPTHGSPPGHGPSPPAVHDPLPHPIASLHEPLPMPGHHVPAPPAFGAPAAGLGYAPAPGAPPAFAAPPPPVPGAPLTAAPPADFGLLAPGAPGAPGPAPYAPQMHAHAAPLSIPGVASHHAAAACSAPVACSFGRSVSSQGLGHSAPPAAGLADSPPSGGAYGLAQSSSSGAYGTAQSPPSAGTYAHARSAADAYGAAYPPAPLHPSASSPLPFAGATPASVAPGYAYGVVPPPMSAGAYDLRSPPPASSGTHLYHPSLLSVPGTVPPHSPIQPGAGGLSQHAPIPHGVGTLPQHAPVQLGAGTLPPHLPVQPGAGALPPHSPVQPGAGALPPHSPVQPGTGALPPLSPARPLAAPAAAPQSGAFPAPGATLAHPPPHLHPHAVSLRPHLHPVGSASSLAAAASASAVGPGRAQAGVHRAASMPSFGAGAADASRVESPPLPLGSPQAHGSPCDDEGRPAAPAWRPGRGAGLGMSSIWAAMNSGPRIFGSNMSVSQALERWNELRSLAGVALDCLETATTEEEVADAIGVLSELRTECTGVTVAAVRAKPEELVAALRANGARESLSPSKHASEIRLSGAQARRLYAWSLRVRRTEEALAVQRRDAIARLIDAAREENLGPVEVAEAISSAARSGRLGGEVHADLLGGAGAVPASGAATIGDVKGVTKPRARARARARAGQAPPAGPAAGRAAPLATASASSGASSSAAGEGGADASSASSVGTPAGDSMAAPAGGDAEYVDPAKAAAELESRLDRMSLRESAQRSQAMLEAIATLEDNLDAFRSIHRMKHCAMFQVMSLTQKIRALTSGCEEIFDSPDVFEAFVEQYGDRVSRGLEPPLHDDEMLEPLAGDPSLGEVLREGVGGGAARGAARGGRGASRAVPALRLTSSVGLVTAVDPGQLAKDAVDSRFPLRTDKDLARFTLPADKSLVARSTPWDPRYVEGSLEAFRDRLEREEDEAAFQDWILGRVSIQSIIAPRQAGQ